MTNVAETQLTYTKLVAELRGLSDSESDWLPRNMRLNLLQSRAREAANAIEQLRYWLVEIEHAVSKMQMVGQDETLQRITQVIEKYNNVLQ